VPNAARRRPVCDTDRHGVYHGPHRRCADAAAVPGPAVTATGTPPGLLPSHLAVTVRDSSRCPLGRGPCRAARRHPSPKSGHGHCPTVPGSETAGPMPVTVIGPAAADHVMVVSSESRVWSRSPSHGAGVRVSKNAIPMPVTGIGPAAANHVTVV
jgi:hypothetical protein